MGGGRRVGVEIEFALVDAPAAAAAVASAIGGEVRHHGPHMAVLEGSPIGTVRFELDTRFAKPAEGPRPDRPRARGAGPARGGGRHALRGGARRDGDRAARRRGARRPSTRPSRRCASAGAVGTRHSPVNAFGMHLNIALVPCAPSWRNPHRRGLCLRRAVAAPADGGRSRPPGDALRRSLSAGLSARARAGLRRAPAPDLGRFISLYADWNPTRNRGLDMWPLLGHLDQEAAEAALGGPVKNPRPAFHYRLPDSDVENPAWTPRARPRPLGPDRGAGRDATGLRGGARRLPAL